LNVANANETPEYWVPDTSYEIISVLLAQQKRKIYGDAESGSQSRRYRS